MSDALTELRERLAEIADLNAAGGLLGWDQQTMMPERAAPQRTE
jgi:carboxypeptidase Taq